MWYVGHAPKHFRCYCCYIRKTRAEKIVRIVGVFLHDCEVPNLNNTDAVSVAAIDLDQALTNLIMSSPFVPLGGEQMEALKTLASIFISTTPAAQNAQLTKDKAPNNTSSTPICAPPPRVYLRRKITKTTIHGGTSEGELLYTLSYKRYLRCTSEGKKTRPIWCFPP